MKKLLCLLTLSLFISQTSFAATLNKEQTQSRIEGNEISDGDEVSSLMLGKVISAKKSPYVIVQYTTTNDSEIKEDGILISKNHVLMGGHSICKYVNELKKVIVKAGDQIIDVTEYAFPETFDCADPACRTDDMAVLTLKESVKTNKFLKVAKNAKGVKKGAAAQIAGFGRVNQNDYFGKLKQSKVKIEKKDGKNFFLLMQYMGTYNYAFNEGSPAVTMKLTDAKNKKAQAIIGLTICIDTNSRGYKQDRVMLLTNKQTKAFLKKATGNAVKFF